MHLRVFLTLIWFLMSQSTSTPPLGPTKVLTTYGKAARNPVYKEIAIPLAFQLFFFLLFARVRESARVAPDTSSSDMSALHTFQWHPREHNWWTAKGMDHAFAFQQLFCWCSGAHTANNKPQQQRKTSLSLLSSAWSLNKIMERAPFHNRSFKYSRTLHETDEYKRQQITYSFYLKRIVCL